MAPPNLSDPAVKTTELWLRRIPAGTFTMGSPPNEPYRGGVNETEHQVTLTQDFYIGVFQMTQKQYELVMGYNPSDYKGDARPVEMASYDDVRGVLLGSQWPANNQVDASSFMGKLRAKTGLTFDLPTEAQWEYACRAGTTTALNNGKYMTTDDGSCPNVAEVARFGATSVTGGTAWDGKGGYSGNFHTVVGMYKPNNWGLYDMHGNLWEWCLDYYDGTDYSAQAVTDPRGIVSGPQRVYRGAGYATILVSSARRNGVKWDSRNNWTGFRVCIQP